MELQEEELRINLVELLLFLKRKLLPILGTVFACTLAGFIVSQFFIPPNYTAATRMYIRSRTSETVVSSDFQVASYVLNDYKVLITGQNVTKEVIRQLNLDMKPQELEEQIQVTAPDNTRVLQISVTHRNPYQAVRIANCIREVAAQQIKTIMDVDAVQLVYEAELPSEPSSPNILRNTLLSGLLGGVAAVGICVLIFLLDDTVRTEEDVTRYLGLTTLGVIPLSPELRHSSQNPEKTQEETPWKKLSLPPFLQRIFKRQKP